MYIKHPRHVPFEYSKITNNIFLGTNQCCQMHFERSLLRKGITADISLEKERIDAPFGVDYFLWLPVVDHYPPTQKQLHAGAHAMKSLIDHGVKVYVHCKRGHGRSPTLVAAYLILKGMTTKEAIKNIKKHRAIHIRDSQLKALETFEKRLRKQQ